MVYLGIIKIFILGMIFIRQPIPLGTKTAVPSLKICSHALAGTHVGDTQIKNYEIMIFIILHVFLFVFLNKVFHFTISLAGLQGGCWSLSQLHTSKGTPEPDPSSTQGSNKLWTYFFAHWRSLPFHSLNIKWHFILCKEFMCQLAFVWLLAK